MRKLIGSSAVNSTADEKERRKKSLIKLGILAFLAFIVWIFSTIAWFAMNDTVSVNNGTVALATSDFEIRVSGDNTGARSTVQNGVGVNATYSHQEIYNLAPNDSFLKNLLNGSLVSGNTYDTNDSNSTIKWRLNQAHTDVEEKGLGPNSQGTLTFQVVPKRDGELNPSFSLQLNGYIAPDQKKNENGSYEVQSGQLLPIDSNSTSDQKKAVELLNGHILFFKNKTRVGGTNENPIYAYSGLLDKDNIELKDIVDSTYLTNGRLISTEDTPITANIYWIWPNTFGQMVFDSSDNNGRTSVGSSSDAISEIQRYVLENTMILFDENVFEFADGISNADKITSIKEMMATSSVSGNETVYTFNSSVVNTGSNLDTLTLGYNSADQRIGTNVNYVLLALSLK